ncbi:MAG: magnesium transporter [Candidatus Cloacimonadota bacterium]|nr:MAG: magnesium transporter [Candidatus Cloacimonadota bacterium]
MRILKQEIEVLLKNKQIKKLQETLETFESVEIAELLRSMTFSQKLSIFSILEIDLLARVFEEFESDEQIQIIESIDKARKAELLDELHPDDRVDFLQEIPIDLKEQLLSIMAQKEARETRELLIYPEQTAGGLMTTKFIKVRKDLTVRQVVNKIKKAAKDVETLSHIYVVDENDVLVGLVTLQDLVLSNMRKKVKSIMQQHPVSVYTLLDQETVAHEVAKYDINTLPVVDERGIIKGIITVDDVIDVINEETTEDMLKFGAAGELSSSYLKQNPFLLARARILWLAILALVGIVSGFIISKNSLILSQVIALAVFIPLLNGSAGNAGTQAVAVMIQALAHGEVKFKDFWKSVHKEFLTGIILGFILGMLGLARAVLFQKSSLIGITVGLTLIINTAIATSLGAVLPLVVKRMNFDPAVISGPLITSIMDVTSLLIYFALVKVIIL